MTSEESRLFINLLFSHKHLWLTFQESDEVYQTLADAVLEGRPLEDSLQTVLLQSQLTQAEVLDKLKGN